MAIWPYRQWVESGPQGTALGELSHGIRLAAVAQEIQVDALVTADPLLLGHRSDSWLSRANVRSVQEAIALVGLFLRCRGDYTVWPEYGLNYGRWGYYWGLTRELLPAAWRWFGACVQSRHRGGAERVQMLGQAALQRVDRALRCRDVAHIEVSKPDSRDAAGQALFHLNALLVALGDAFDAVAHVAHIVYEMPMSEFRLASWGKRAWLKNLRNYSAPTVAVLADGML
jgi:hypothetical protein